MFHHATAHEALTGAGWKVGTKVSENDGRSEGAIYHKGKAAVKVTSRHNPNRNTVVHNILHHGA